MLLKLCKLPSGSPCLFIGKLKIYLTKSWCRPYWDNLNSAYYLDIGCLRIKYKKDYRGHAIS